mgnify:CR=1 FL=1
MQFLHPERDEHLELSTQDVFIVPGFYSGRSRRDVDLTPPDLPGSSQPVVTANMNAVTGKRMAECMARYGGLGVLPQDMRLETVARIVRHIKNAPSGWDTPLVVSPEATIRDVQGLIRKRDHDMVAVVDAQHHPVGIVTHADLRGYDQYAPIHTRMNRDVVTVSAEHSRDAAFLHMEEKRVKAAPVLDANGRLCGMLTRDDCVRFAMQPPSLDAAGRLQVAAAVGISADAASTAAQLHELGIDVIVLDTAHGHQQRMLESLQAVRATLGPHAPIVAGNVCTAEGTRALIEAGANIVKVNVGPGAMCSTRMQTGAGRPTFSAVRACARQAHALGGHVWADGGVRYPRDVSLYLAAGAARVMVGTLFAGTYESPGDIQVDAGGQAYKENYGMASARAVHERTPQSDLFERAKQALFEEGISKAKIYLRPGQEGAGDLLFQILTGVRSAYTYVGAHNWHSLQAKARVGVQTPSGYREGEPKP